MAAYKVEAAPVSDNVAGVCSAGLKPLRFLGTCLLRGTNSDFSIGLHHLIFVPLPIASVVMLLELVTAG